MTSDTESSKTAAAATKSASVSVSETTPSWGRTVRETVESIVIAFILAFLFRTFEAEAFVIPTGSMAPTLQGRHKDLACAKCNYGYRVGDSGGETDAASAKNLPQTTCPMCGFTMKVNGRIDGRLEYPTYNGDRILVNKFAYDFAEPKRWDVVVFKYPEDAKTNYIKRLVGLPGESLTIADGDIYIRNQETGIQEIARKPTADKMLAMLHDVYDNDYVFEGFLAKGWPSRWQNVAGTNETSAWQADESTKVFSHDGTGGESWLRYQHLYQAMVEAWTDYLNRPDLTSHPKADLIRNTYAYNVAFSPSSSEPVGDLVFDAEVDIGSTSGEVILELVKDGRRFQARIDVSTGEATLAIVGVPEFKQTASTSVIGRGSYRLRFANVDQQLWLFVNDQRIEFPGDGIYKKLDNDRPVDVPPSPELGSDLRPVGIATNGVPLTVRHLKIRRDIYYTSPEQPGAKSKINLLDSADNDLDQFFMLGDNSPASKDGRLWDTVHYVERQLLIGKAIYIYWPHAWPANWSIRVPLGGLEFDFPFWPNFSRMGRVR